MNKEAYIQKFEAQLKEWNADLDKLQAKAQNTEAETKIKLDEQLTALRRQRDEAQHQLEQIQSSAGDAWEQFKQGAQESWSNLNEAVTRAKSQFQ